MPSKLTILFLGDVVGKAGRKLLHTFLPDLIQKISSDLVIVNIENIAGGKGPNLKVMDEIENLPIDVYTTGGHFYDHREFVTNWEHFPRVIRPANFPDGNPGNSYFIATCRNGENVVVLQLMGRTFMKPIDCPFKKADSMITELKKKGPIIIDFHAEATSEKSAFGHYLDGRVAAVLGTHTHIPTADERILPGGTAYITDTGMVGAYDGVIGFKKEVIVDRFVHMSPRRFEPSTGDPMMSVVILSVDSHRQKAYTIKRRFITSGEDIDSIHL